jgi:MFS transporter, ACS family, hexuronate transporter
MSPWWTQRRWWIAILLCLVTAIGSIDRQAMSVAGPTVVRELGLTNTQFGQLGFAFLLAYAVGQLFAGVLVDRLGTKRALTLAVVWWSIAAMSHALARSFGGFFTARAFLGLTEGANLPAAFKAVAEWFPKEERSMAAGIVSAGSGLGLILAPPVAGFLVAGFGWQAAFLVPGAAGILWVLLWRRQYFLPEAHPRVTAAERALALRDRIGSAPVALTLAGRVRLWAYYLRYRETWGLVLARFAGDGAFYFFAFWLPQYLSSEHGFDVLKIAAVAWIPFLAADLGVLTGGWAGQRLIARGWSVDRSRKTLIWAGASGVLVALPVTSAASWPVALLLVSLAIGSLQVKTASLFPLAADLYPARDVATVWGLSGAAGSFGAALFQWLFGWLIDAFSYYPVFVIVSTMCLVQALIVSLFIRRIEPLEGTPAHVPHQPRESAAL